MFEYKTKADQLAVKRDPALTRNNITACLSALGAKGVACEYAGGGDSAIEAGQIHLEDGTCIDLLKIQQICNEIFQDTGDHRAMEVADDLSKLTGVWQGPHGDWLNNVEHPRG